VQQTRIRRPEVRRPWPEVLRPIPQDPDVVRAKALARAATQLAEGRAADCQHQPRDRHVIRRNAY
jgi:hypothetical protein